MTHQESANYSSNPIIIEPSRGWRSLGLKDVWTYRELLYFLALRHIKIRYKQTVLGAAWAILQPVLTMIIFTIFFGTLAGVPSDNFPYPVFVYSALVPWTFFAQSLTQSSESLVANSNLITKVYFPRLIIPFSIIGSNILDFLLAFSVLILLLLGYGLVPTINILLLPVFLLLCAITSLGVGLWFTALNVQFRDVRHVVPFIVQLWLFITPVIYSASRLGKPWSIIYGINPMVSVIEGFRWALLGSTSTSGGTILLSTTVGLLILVSGIIYFRRMEKVFADII